MRGQDKKKRKSYKEKLYEQYSKEEADKRWNEYKLKISQTKEAFIFRYGEELGTKKYNEFVDKSKQTKTNFIKRHGKELGEKLWEEFLTKKKKSSKRSLEYWLVFFDGDYQKAKEQLELYQSKSLNWYIKKYGPEKGKKLFQKRYKNHSDFMKKRMNKKENRELCGFTNKQLIEKYGKNKAKEIILSKQTKFNGVSKISQIFCNKLYETLPKDIQKYCWFDSLNKEWFLFNGDGYYFYDFCITKSNVKIIIEFNGDFWHANPQLYSENWYHPVRKLKSSEIWNLDQEKIEFARLNGWEVITVWEKDWEIKINDIRERILKICS